MTAWYNENDAKKAACLREFIRAGLIAKGEVDERSITEVKASDLKGFRQCHFFAGFGVWSYALRLAGFPDDGFVWTGSCPCPSFSCAGKGAGFNDPRHLWPAWFGLIRERRPARIFGEQADDAIGYGWLDLVQSDLESAAYSVGKAVLGAHSVGAPHIRQRLYFCAYAESGRLQQHDTSERPVFESGAISATRDCADTDGGNASAEGIQRSGEHRLLAEDCGTGEYADTNGARREQCGKRNCESQRGKALESGNDAGRCDTDGDSSESLGAGLERHAGHERERDESRWLGAEQARSITTTGATRGFWRDCEWWYGRDGKYRPIEPGIFPLAHGAANRVLKLRGYGDAIVAPLAAEFIAASEEVSARHNENDAGRK